MSTTRRQFLAHAGIGVAAVGLAAAGSACGRHPTEAATDRAPFPVVVARGTPEEIGRAIGAATAGPIRTCLERRGTWFADLRTFALADRTARLDAFVQAIATRHPDVLAELRGLAAGAGLPFDDLLVLNLQPELGAMKAQTSCGDCSTLQFAQGGRLLLAHNEDDHEACRDLMALLHVRPSGAPAFVSLAYPGVLSGNVPAWTAAGLVRTTNFISARKVVPGVPRYVLGRAVLAAPTVDAAVAVAASKDSAFSFHLNLGSLRERRLISLEVAPGGAFAVREAHEELFIHTNHFVLPATRDVPQDAAYAGGSSDSRYRVLDAAVRGLPSLDRVGEADLVRLLASHDAITRPYSPCRHPEGDIRGRTMATALFDLTAGTFALYEGNPCEGRRHAVAQPS